MNSNNVVVWENTDYFKTLFLQEISKTQNQRQEEFCAFSEVTLLYRDTVDNYKSMFESRISAGAAEKLPETKATEKPDDEMISSWSHDVECHAKKCVERYCELAKKQLSNYVKSRRHACMIINSKKKKKSH